MRKSIETQMRFWLVVQLLIVLVFLAIATLITDSAAPAALSLLVVPLVMFVRIQHVMLANERAVLSEFRVVALFLA
ncbi:MAG: hypothetical protein F4227_09205 [Gammaproteobacteria bacterium]|nr:hypothetical protein [Gammaproteobacteria bacterium]MYF03127.1 hypothetical protein [Gammaproteobacteria bacterium]MYI77973.1 hypothetical protein [Gammaproteobacteria bacterium]